MLTHPSDLFVSGSSISNEWFNWVSSGQSRPNGWVVSKISWLTEYSLFPSPFFSFLNFGTYWSSINDNRGCGELNGWVHMASRGPKFCSSTLPAPLPLKSCQLGCVAHALSPRRQAGESLSHLATLWVPFSSTFLHPSSPILLTP